MSGEKGRPDVSSPRSTATEPVMNVISYIKLPELVLEVIFKNLSKEPETLASCTRVDNLWDELLWTKKSDFMFHLVLPLIAKQNRLSYLDLMNCRLVSHSWRHAVDILNKKALQLGITSEEASIARVALRKLPFSGWSRFDIEKNPESFLHLMRTSCGKNVFPTRVVFFENNFPTGESVDDLLEHSPDRIVARHQWDPAFARSLLRCHYFHEMLQLFGSQVWHLVYSIQRSSLPPLSRNSLNTYNHLSPKYLAKMLSLVPHLRSFAVKDVVSRCPIYWDGPAPPLPNLRSLTLRFHACSPPITDFLFTSYGTQLESLECLDEDLLLAQIKNNGRPFAFHNLRELTIHSSFYGFHKLKRLKIASSLRNEIWWHDDFLKDLDSSLTAPRLQKVSLELLYLGCEMRTLWNLMAGIGAFSSSLVEADVSVVVVPKMKYRTYHSLSPPVTCEDKESSDLENFVDSFPLVTSFRLSSAFDLESPDFLWVLSKFPKLKVLRIVGQNKKVKGFDNVAHIWAASKSLQRLYIGERCENREQGSLRVLLKGVVKPTPQLRQVVTPAQKKMLNTKLLLLQASQSLEQHALGGSHIGPVCDDEEEEERRDIICRARNWISGIGLIDE